MSRRLVDLYPCKRCQAPCEVKCRRDIDKATCERCAEIQHGLWIMSYGHQRSNVLAHAANREKDELRRLMGWLSSIGTSFESISRGGLPILTLLDDTARRSVLKSLRLSLEHARCNIAVLEQLVDAVAETHGPRLRLVNGGRE